MWAGVGKSGSPAPKPITCSPGGLQGLGLGVHRQCRRGPQRRREEVRRTLDVIGGVRRHGSVSNKSMTFPRHSRFPPSCSPATAASVPARPRSGPSRSTRCRRRHDVPRHQPPPEDGQVTGGPGARRPAATSSRCPTATRWCSATAGRPCFWDAATFGLIDDQSQHLSFGEFSSKFAACAAAAPHLKDPQIIESEVGTHPLPVGRRRGRPLRPDPQRDLDRRGDAHPPPAAGADLPGGGGLVAVDGDVRGRRPAGRPGASSTPTTSRPRSASPATADCGSPSCRRPPSSASSASPRRALDPGLPRPQDGGRQLRAGPDLQHAGPRHHLPAGRAARLDERQRRPGVDGRRAATARPRSSTPGPSSQASPDPSSRTRERSHVVGTIDFVDDDRRHGRRRSAAGQRHRRHRAVPQARSQPAPDRDVPRRRPRRCRITVRVYQLRRWASIAHPHS